jgi:hypothetical protein
VTVAVIVVEVVEVVEVPPDALTVEISSRPLATWPSG